MLKKILIFALLLNVPYTRSSDISVSPRYDIAALCTAVGAACAWFSYKDFQKVWQVSQEWNHHLKTLKEMGVEVRIVSNSQLKTRWDGSLYIVIKEHYTIDMPSRFSQEEKKKAQEHFNLFLASNKRIDDEMPVIKSLASLVLLPIGLMELSTLFKSH